MNYFIVWVSVMSSILAQKISEKNFKNIGATRIIILGRAHSLESADVVLDLCAHFLHISLRHLCIDPNFC